jgi:hypothetical protein
MFIIAELKKNIFRSSHSVWKMGGKEISTQMNKILITICGWYAVIVTHMSTKFQQ